MLQQSYKAFLHNVSNILLILYSYEISHSYFNKKNLTSHGHTRFITLTYTDFAAERNKYIENIEKIKRFSIKVYFINIINVLPR